MIIGGCQPCSLCDYPGHVAAVVFTQGCNFRCPFCHNGALLPIAGGAAGPAARLGAGPAERTLPSVDEVLHLLQRRRGLLDAVVISGGEPTLHEDLPHLLTRIRAMGFAIKLDTNGSQPERLRALLRAGLVDAVAMDVKAPWEKYDLLAGVAAPVEAIRESIALLAESGCAHLFRTTRVPALLTERDLTTIREAMLPFGSPYRVQPFRPENALDPCLRQLSS